MDRAQTLIRSVVRSFYTPEYILIIDAVILHSALRDDDLAFLMGSQTKHTRKLCSRLREDGLLNVHSRPEIKPGANKAFARDYYFINFHRAIDIVKYRLKSMTREIEKRFGQTAEEKKEYFCPRCKSEWTIMEVLDSTDPSSEFVCKRCGNVLTRHGDEAQNSVGHEMQSRLNAQLAAFELLMRQIDDVEVPENDFEAALANARPVIRDPNLNPGVRSEAAPGRSNLPAATVHGMHTEQDRIQVNLHDASQARKLEADEADRRMKLAEQNALPSWHTTSTVTGERTELGIKEEAMRREREATGAFALRGGDTDEEKKPVEALQDNSQLDAYFAAVREDEAKRNREEQEDDDDDEDDEDDDEDEDDFEDVAMDDGSGNASPAKRLKVDEPKKNGDANGASARRGDTSVATSVASGSTPASVAAAPAKLEQEESARQSRGASNEVSAEDSDEDEFENAM